jgi:pimeloyl-ACP methyl ester carboxylesterase
MHWKRWKTAIPFFFVSFIMLNRRFLSVWKQIFRNNFTAQIHEIMTDDIKPFAINIPESDIEDLKNRIANTRWTDEITGSGWNYGTNRTYLKELTDYWQHIFNWKAQEEKLNTLHNYMAVIEGYEIHFVYEKGFGKTSTPIVLLHGWPATYIQMLKIIPLLQQEDENGHSFDVIVPSLIGYGFSKPATEKGMGFHKMAGLFQKLLVQKLGYEKFILRGTDLGTVIAREWSLAFPENVLGLHLSGSNPFIYHEPANLSAAEKTFLQKCKFFMVTEGAYIAEQSTKPQTLAYGLNDSPVGLAAWIMEKFKSWSDNNGNPESKFTKDELLTNISIYWFTQTIGPSFRLYCEGARTPSSNMNKKVQSPVAFLMLQKDIAIAPKEWEDRIYANITRWTKHPAGGHFSEWEEPEAVARDIVAFTKTL